MKRILLALVLALSIAAPKRALAVEVTTSQQYAQGQQVQASDLSSDFEAVRNLSGILATLLLGSKNALPNVNPLAVALSSSALTFTVGGAGQFAIAQDISTSGNARVVDSCPQTSFTIPANSTGSTRIDLVSIQYQQIPTNGHSVTFSDGSVRTVYNALEGCAFSYNAGTTTPPSGYVAFAQIAVPSGSTVASQSAVTYLFATVSSLFRSTLGNIVSSLGGLSGAISLAGGNGITVTSSGSTITVSTSAAINPVTALNNLSGSLTLTSSNGSLSISPSGSTVNLAVNFPASVNALNSQTGNVTIAAGVGLSATTSSGTITFTNTGVTSLAGAGGTSVSSSTGVVTITGFGSQGGSHVEVAQCSATTAATNGYFTCTASFSGGASFAAASYVCSTSYVSGFLGASGQGAGSGWRARSTSQVDLFTTSGATVSALCVGT